MFDDENESETPPEHAADPATQAREKSDEFRMHAELVAVFEGHRKYDAQFLRLDPDLARDIQRTIGKLEKLKLTDIAVIAPESAADAARLLDFPATHELSTGDYHIHRRPGEVMIVRLLQGEEVETFYTRLQAHFDAALNQYREEERQSKEWKQDPATLAYLKALEALEINMPDRYLREIIRRQNVFVLSTQSADEMDILHLCDFVMGVDPVEVLGPASAPPDQASERDRAWFFKLFSLRGMHEGQERMCFFAYLQKSDDAEW